MSNVVPQQKPIIGFTSGDINGVGLELIIKVLADPRILDILTPVVFANNKVVNFYRKSIPELTFNFTVIKELARIPAKQVSVINCWEEEVAVTPGILNETGGTYAAKSLHAAAAALKEGHIHGVVTAPVHKKNILGATFNYTGHTPFFKEYFGAKDVLMFMCAENIKVGLVTEHVAVKEIADNLTREKIMSKLQLMNQSLQKDFGIDRPKIAVLGLNPHAGDEGLIGTEDEELIKPAVKDAKQHNILAMGPFSADAFFARGQHKKFDGVLAMYHDQGLIPFKSLAIGEGINFTAGMQVVRTSPDHGTAFDIAGKNKGNEESFRAAVFACVDILEKRGEYADNRKNPMRKMGNSVVANAIDEKISED